ncbi:hypothetical protein K2173_013079 [Erythroxylum novogranatense]|uniref:Secreted protein n=1 Tax=Erythroxylum novogranatense TaxID=1862640 RepID=A0AAV8S618_9ROSI|nr:hypothetical protein K2173_013079 [Erythroxylum novogranatense]
MSVGSAAFKLSRVASVFFLFFFVTIIENLASSSLSISLWYKFLAFSNLSQPPPFSPPFGRGLWSRTLCFLFSEFLSVFVFSCNLCLAPEKLEEKG